MHADMAIRMYFFNFIPTKPNANILRAAFLLFLVVWTTIKDF